MCRLFASLSTMPRSALDPFVRAKQSIYVQSVANPKHLQPDGWGVGWFEKGLPHVIKSPRPLFRERRKAEQAARKATSHLLLGHVRWASNPLKLPKEQLIGLNHTQPFTHGRWLFAHNGTLYIPREVIPALGVWSRYIKGRNDSEVLFYWLLKTLAPVLSHPKSITAARVATTLRQSHRALDQIWKGCRSKYPLYRYPAHGLNWLLSNGTILIASCYVTPNGFDRSRALLNRRQPYFQMQWQQDAQHVSVASEPLDRHHHWTPFHHGDLIVAKRTTRGMVVEKSRVSR